MKTFSIHTVRNVLAFFIALGLGYVAYTVNPSSVTGPKVEAGTTQNLSGRAWSLGTKMGSESADPTAGPYSTTVGSSSGLGWISFNSLDCDTNGNGFIDISCGGFTSTGIPNNGSNISTEDYGVNLSQTNRGALGTDYFSGQAWSENIGWVSFNPNETLLAVGTSYCSATYGGTRAQINWATGKVTGWARALSGAPSPAWDGCISLSGMTNEPTPKPYGVSISNNNFSGYAWGDVSIGWVDFGPSVGGVFVGVHLTGAGKECLDTDPTILWGTCQALTQCTNPPSTVPNVPGIQQGACSNGVSATPRNCTVTTQTCTIVTPPSSGKTRFWQF